MQPPLLPLRACRPTEAGAGAGPSSPGLGAVAAGGSVSGASGKDVGVRTGLAGRSRLASLPAGPRVMADASPAEEGVGLAVEGRGAAGGGGVVDGAAHGGGDRVTDGSVIPTAPCISRVEQRLAADSGGGGGGGGSSRGGGGGVELMFADDLEPEDDEGAVEYKWSLVQPPPARFLELVTQMKYRLLEGSGECIYEIGVTDDGRARGLSPDALAASLSTLSRMAEELHAECTVIRRARATGGEVGDMVASVLVRQLPETLEDYLDLRVAVAGNVDSGKSTLIGVLTGCGALDNGRGRARAQVFTHKHEMESGRTSSVSQQIMGFGASGAVVNYTGVRSLTWADVVARAAKIVTFFDLAGHERYVKTTVFGLTAHAPDYCMLVRFPIDIWFVLLLGNFAGVSVYDEEACTRCVGVGGEVLSVWMWGLTRPFVLLSMLRFLRGRPPTCNGSAGHWGEYGRTSDDERTPGDCFGIEGSCGGGDYQDRSCSRSCVRRDRDTHPEAAQVAWCPQASRYDQVRRRAGHVREEYCP